MAQRTCTLCNSFVSIDNINKHYDEYHSKDKNKWPTLSNRYHNNMMSSDDDNDNINNGSLSDSVPLQPSFTTDFEVFLYHKRTPQEIEARRNNNISYPIAWYDKPFRSTHYNGNYAIRTLWCDNDTLYTESVQEIAKVYPDFKQKILNSEFKHILSNNNNNNNNDNKLDWTDKALLIINCLLKDKLSKPFRQKVDEERDAAPKYYETIKEPMDLTTLKQLITNKKIPSSKKFVTNLMLIWDNAQNYNQKSHQIYQYAVKLKTKSNKLIKKYWANDYKNLYESKRRSQRLRRKKRCNYNTNPVVMDDNNLHLLCSLCNNKLKFMCGFHKDCEYIMDNSINIKSEDEISTNSLDLVSNNNIKCNECQIVINNTNICYYHCEKGCQMSNYSEDELDESSDDPIGYHSVFLCEICAQRYNLKQYKITLGSYGNCNNNRNGIIDNRLAFYGCFIDLVWNGNEIWYEAIKMECDGDEIFYELILSSETSKRFITHAKVINTNENGIIFEVNKGRTNFTKGILSKNGLMLKFIDCNDENCLNTFHKTRIFCKKCQTETQFMVCNMFPSYDISSSIYCDTHDIYYDKEKLLPNNERCLSFKYLSNEYNNNIYKQDFYFSCVKCNDFDQCAVCTLIQKEKEFKQTNSNIKSKPVIVNSNNNIEPSHKRQRVNDVRYIERNNYNQQMLLQSYDNIPTVNVSKIINKKCNKRHRNEMSLSCGSVNVNTNYEYEKLKELYINEKRKNQEMNKIKVENNNLKSELEICQLENVSLRRKYNSETNNLNTKIVKLTNERDQWIQKCKQLKENVISAANKIEVE